MNHAVKHRVKIARERFIKSIDSSTVCQLASSYNNGDPCTIFGKPIAGSYNICFPVVFSLQGKKWMVRIPLPPCVAFVDEKLESEIATMRFVAERTTIPIPRIHGYAFQKNSCTGFAYMIIDYVDGRPLFDVDIRSLAESEKAHLYKQLARFYIQLRSHEFPHIGSLTISNDARGWSFDVLRRPMSIELNGYEIEGLQATRILGKDAIFKSAKDYFTSLMDFAFNHFQKSKNSIYDEDDARIALYNLYQFQEVVNSWADPKYDSGPFVLMHGDFRPPNIVVDDDFNVLGIIDWEWSFVVPIQLFHPPTWLTGRELRGVCSYFDRKDYIQQLAQFKGIVEASGEEAASLLDVWSGIEQDGRFLIPSALLHPAHSGTVYAKYFDMRRHDRPLQERVLEFIRSDWRYQDLIQKKLVDRHLYLEELRELGLEDKDGIAVPIEKGTNQFFETWIFKLRTTVFHTWDICARRFQVTTHLSLSIAAVTIGGLTLVAATGILHHLSRWSLIISKALPDS